MHETHSKTRREILVAKGGALTPSAAPLLGQLWGPAFGFLLRSPDAERACHQVPPPCRSRTSQVLPLGRFHFAFCPSRAGPAPCCSRSVRVPPPRVPRVMALQGALSGFAAAPPTRPFRFPRASPASVRPSGLSPRPALGVSVVFLPTP